MKKTKLAFLHSVLALLLCVSMLVGTTFAWFTDGVTSGKNRIVAGNLDVELYYMNDETSTWQPVGKNTNVFKQDTLWEPGHTEVVKLKVVNAGTLALKYQLGIYVASEVQGTNMAGETFKLSDYIQYGVVEGDQNYDRKAAVSAVSGSAKKLNEAYAKPGTLNSGEAVFTVVVYMPESVGNVANYRGDAVPKIELGIQLAATQMGAELDSFGPDYDKDSYLPLMPGSWTATASVSVENGAITTAATVGTAADRFTAEVPAGVKVEAGVEELTLEVSTKQESGSNVHLEMGQVGVPMDVHIDGVAEDNTTPMTINLGVVAPTGLYDGNVNLYHVEKGITEQMVQVATLTELDAHNEFYYDTETGAVVLSMATFSEVFIAISIDNPWNGAVDVTWYDPGVNSFVLDTPMQLAGFAQIVGGMAKDADGNVIEDNFAGKTVSLGKDMDLGGKIWYPVGYYNSEGSYEKSNTAITSGLKAFSGTFEGNGKTISNFRQSTWEMKGDHNWYAPEDQHYRDGMGLFGLLDGGTVQNLVIDGMVAEGEITDIGCVTAYARGDCKFDNILINNVSCYSYNCRTAGIVGYDWVEGEGSKLTFSNIKINPNCTFGALWGSWDVACAGILGFMDESSTAQFENCEVGCKLDVFNDVCANYQYYQYRYSGMMIGTVGKDGEPDGSITFNNCVVYYGSWADYYYCEFEENTMASYSEDYQFSRVDKSEITEDENGNLICIGHDHTAEEDKQAVYLPFRQLYTGYGWGANPVIEGITVIEAKYTITYVNDSKTLDVVYVTDNSSQYTNITNENAEKLALQWANIKFPTQNVKVSYWMNAGSTEVSFIEANHDEDVVLYPSFSNVYTVTFVDQNGNPVGWDTFTNGDYTNAWAKVESLEAPYIGEDFEFFNEWEIRTVDASGKVSAQAVTKSTFSGANNNITLYPVYKYNGDVQLIPIDNDADGDTDYYQVGGYSTTAGVTELVEIPGSVNGILVTTINADAFSSYDDLHSILIPQNIKTINNQAFTAEQKEWYQVEARDTVTMYYQGTSADMKQYMDVFYQNNSNYKKYNTIEYTSGITIFQSGWDNNMGAGSRIFFMGKNGKVDLTQGYWQLESDKSVVGKQTKHRWVYYEYSEVTQDLLDEYQGTCCDTCTEAGKTNRPDYDYWKDLTLTTN